MKRTAAALIGVSLAIGACVVTAFAPDTDQKLAPFVTMGAVGDAVTGRELSVTVHEAVLTRDVSDGDEWKPRGTWLLVRLEASMLTSEENAKLHLARAVIDDTVFHVSPTMPDSLLEPRLRVGIPTQGWLGFELPADADPHRVTMDFMLDTMRPRRDSVVAVTADSLEWVDRVEITRATVGESK